MTPHWGVGLPWCIPEGEQALDLNNLTVLHIPVSLLRAVPLQVAVE